MTRRRDPNTWTTMRIPERELPEIILELATPLLAQLGETPALDDVRAELLLAVTFWNASVLASPWRHYTEPNSLKDLKKRMRGREAPRADAMKFDLLTARWRKHVADPRLVASWSYELDEAGHARLLCTTNLPDGVRAEIPPPADERVRIGGKFLDEVRISRGDNSYLVFPVDRHRGVVHEDGTATVRAMMPAVVQLFAEGRLPSVEGAPVEIAIAGRTPQAMVLAKISCSSANFANDVAVLTFRPAGGTDE